MLRRAISLWLISLFIPTFRSDVLNRQTISRQPKDVKTEVPIQNDFFMEPTNTNCVEKDQNCNFSLIQKKLEPPENPGSLEDAEELDTTASTDSTGAGAEPEPDLFNPNKTLEELLNSNTTKETPETTTSKMDESIILPRNNCNMEIHVNDYEDRKLRIFFSPLENESIGQCQIALNGEEKSMLAVLITEIKLHRSGKNDRDCLGDEILRVVLTNTGINFTVKQYCGEEDHYPVILTDTNRVYLVLSYHSKGTVPELQESSFSLEAFTYEKNENNISLGQNENLSSYYGNSPNGQNVENIYFTTDTPILKRKKR